MGKRIGVAVIGSLLGIGLTVGLAVAASASGAPRPVVPAVAHPNMGDNGACC
ncbi:hypothetical protein [Streptacidiphilus jiangxiensis]|uniref:Uncharacterized protein n=1 Tax=Streptacidiphilus jiangxiensis TaxID=235985 RepID=A0A1H7HS50_STRJI|nr:hypothetical protein [Streptacidiphilus jiangxiensis]SEK51850.1 hypothetical protein SAMN05414137_102287 [Streptacidiphilus jiangxiensis]